MSTVLLFDPPVASALVIIIRLGTRVGKVEQEKARGLIQGPIAYLLLLPASHVV